MRWMASQTFFYSRIGVCTCSQSLFPSLPSPFLKKELLLYTQAHSKRDGDYVLSLRFLLCLFQRALSPSWALTWPLGLLQTDNVALGLPRIFSSHLNYLNLKTALCIYVELSEVWTKNTLLTVVHTQQLSVTIDGFHGAWLHFRRARVGVCV